MKSLVVCYSNTGNNRYLAGRLARELSCDMEEIRPRIGAFPMLLIFSLVKVGAGAWRLKHNVRDYDSVVLCGPIWMGQFIYPLRWFVNKHRSRLRHLHFATCCGSSEEEKDGKFGHAKVFGLVRDMLGDMCGHCQAFPIGLVLPEEKRKDGDAVMKARLSDDSFTGETRERFDRFVTSLRNH